ncbi:ABC transporter permease subunit [Variovorax terrae]|uniref:ABC transporter permease subunit n=1 Tax=Variovorax terrae TaxID=2923278 RepID=A0A9X2ALH7_9BURK|nr:ABC transporter permease subunit [Variovorax terrae]MCJ0761675.1 ABC transporter permease subunit [Variovorax terrae]
MKNPSRQAVAWALALPALLLLVVFFFYPLLRIAGLSVGFPKLLLADYATVFNPVNRMIAVRTFSIAGIITLVTLLLAYPMAAFLCQAHSMARKLAMLCVVIPFLTSFLVRSYAWVVLLGDEGAINSALRWLGLIADPLELLYNRFGMSVGMVHIMLPLLVLPIYASMRGIDPMQWKATQALGGGALRSFLTVYLPQTYAGIRSGCTLVFILSLGFYITPAMLGSSRDLMLGNLIAANVETATHYGLSAAIAFVLLAGTVLVFAAVRRREPRPQPGALARLFMHTLGLERVAVALSRRRWRCSAGRVRRGGGRFKARWLLVLFGVLMCLYLLLPSMIVVVASFNGQDSLAFPPQQWSLRWYRFLLSDEQWALAGGLSLKIALASTALTMLLGTLASYGIARLRGTRAGRVIYGAALAPMVVPSVVTALGAFAVLSDMGLFGTMVGVVIMHTCLSIPLVTVLMVAAFSSFDERLEMAAQSLGASRWRTFRRVVVPLVASSLLSSLLMAFLHSFDEVVLTSFIAGTRMMTVPLKMWENIRNQVDPAIAALSSLLILIPFVVLALQGLPGRRRPRSNPPGGLPV